MFRNPSTSRNIRNFSIQFDVHSGLWQGQRTKQQRFKSNQRTGPEVKREFLRWVCRFKVSFRDCGNENIHHRIIHAVRRRRNYLCDLRTVRKVRKIMTRIAMLQVIYDDNRRDCDRRKESDSSNWRHGLTKSREEVDGYTQFIAPRRRRCAVACNDDQSISPRRRGKVTGRV